MKRICLLGSTGSIGTSTLDVVRHRPGEFCIYALVAGRRVDRLIAQIREFRPGVAVVADDAVLDQVKNALESSGLPRSEWPELGAGPAARVSAATAAEVDFVMSAIVGVAGLEATYQAARCRKRIGLANKEVLVASGKLVMEAARQTGAEVIPVDSEHNGAHQCLRCGSRSEVTRLILTASGGPFRDTPIQELQRVSPAQALRHPIWKEMGQRITIDSATLMNKGFEVIEACWLFDLRPDEVDVVVHPQSTVHAMVEYDDGSIIAQVATADMRMPIQYALTWPARAAAQAPRLDWTHARQWDFFPPDLRKFPLLGLAYQAQRAGGSAACTLNAADEIAVEAFLAGTIPFTGIAEVVSETLEAAPGSAAGSVQQVLEIDRESRRIARETVAARAGRQTEFSLRA